MNITEIQQEKIILKIELQEAKKKITKLNRELKKLVQPEQLVISIEILDSSNHGDIVNNSKRSVNVTGKFSTTEDQNNVKIEILSVSSNDSEFKDNSTNIETFHK